MDKTPTLTPIWKYKANDYDSNVLSEIHLLIWSGGFSVCGYGINNTPILIQTYMTRERPNLSLVNHLISQDSLLKGNNKKVKKIWLSDERNLLVPKTIYEESHASMWFRKFHYLESDEVLLDFDLGRFFDGRLLFPLSEESRTLLENHFPKADFEPISKIVFQKSDKEEEAILQMVCLPREIIFSLCQNSRFIFHLVYPYESSKNIVFKIALILEEKGILQEQIKPINFSGIAPYWNNLLNELPPFFPIDKSIQDTTKITLDFFKNLPKCV